MSKNAENQLLNSILDLDDSPDTTDTHQENPDNNQNQNQNQNNQDQQDDPPLKLDDDSPTNTPPAKRSPGRPTKEDSMVLLRNERDQIRNDLAARDQRIAELEAANPYKDIDPEFVKEFFSFVTEKFGDSLPSSEELRGAFQNLQQSDSTLQELQNRVEGYEKRLTEVDVRQSQTFIEKYEKPLRLSIESLKAELINIDQNGNEIAPELTNQLVEVLGKIQDPSPKNIKIALAGFSEKFKQLTGKDYLAPSLVAVSSALEKMHSSGANYTTAFNSWKEQKQKDEEERNNREFQERKQTEERLKSTRRNSSTSVMRAYDFDSLSGLKDKKEIVNIFNEEFNYAERMIQNPQEAPEYGKLVEARVHARLFPELLKKVRSLESELELARKDTGKVRVRPSANNQPEKEGAEDSLLKSILPR